jgi:hypothetical protein
MAIGSLVSGNQLINCCLNMQFWLSLPTPEPLVRDQKNKGTALAHQVITPAPSYYKYADTLIGIRHVVKL